MTAKNGAPSPPPRLNKSLPLLGVSETAKTKSVGAWENIYTGSTSAVNAAELRRPFANSVWVMAAIKHVATPIGAVPLSFTRDRRGGEELIDDPALTAFWERPAKTRGGTMSRNDFLTASIGWLKLRGEAFWILDDTWLTPRAAKSPILMARPQDMLEILDGRRELIGWRWTDASGTQHALIPEQVRQLKFWNPYNEFRGLAEWEAAKMAADADYAQGVFAKNLAKNNGDRGPYIIGKDGTASDPQIAQITAQLRQKRELALRGDFRPVFITGDLDVKEPGLQSVDAAYVAQRLENRHEIFIAFGVPPSFAEVTASYSVGSASDRFKLIEDTCMPLGVKLADEIEAISAWFLGRPKEAIFAEFDWRKHSTMQAVRREVFDSFLKGVGIGMPPRIAGEYFDLSLPRWAGDEIGRIPFNLTEIEADGGTENPEPAEPAEEDPDAEIEKLFQQRCSVHAPVGKHICKGGHTKADDAAAAKRAALWARLHRKREPWERKFESKVSRHLMDARAETLRKIAKAASSEGKTIETKALSVLDLLFDLTAWLEAWTKGLASVSRAALEAAGFECWTEELNRDDALTLPASEVTVALKNRENRIKDAGTKVWNAVRDDLQSGIDAGETTEQLANRVRSKFKGIEQSRAKKIATTETTVAYETARDMTFRAAGVQWSQWLHSGLVEHARLNHQAADGQIREVGQPFDVGSAELLYPGDPDAPASEVIGCKCVRIAVAGPEDDAEIIGNDPDEDIPY